MRLKSIIKIHCALSEANAPPYEELNINTTIIRIKWLGNRVKEMYDRWQNTDQELKKTKSLLEQEQSRSAFWQEQFNNVSMKLNKIHMIVNSTEESK